jgi:hypothetical protein
MPSNISQKESPPPTKKTGITDVFPVGVQK